MESAEQVLRGAVTTGTLTEDTWRALHRCLQPDGSFQVTSARAAALLREVLDDAGVTAPVTVLEPKPSEARSGAQAAETTDTPSKVTNGASAWPVRLLSGEWGVGLDRSGAPGDVVLVKTKDGGAFKRRLVRQIGGRSKRGGSLWAAKRVKGVDPDPDPEV